MHVFGDINLKFSIVILTFVVWISPSVDVSSSESFLRGGQKPTLTIQSAGHALHVFINGQFSGILLDFIFLEQLSWSAFFLLVRSLIVYLFVAEK